MTDATSIVEDMARAIIMAHWRDYEADPDAIKSENPDLWEEYRLTASVAFAAARDGIAAMLRADGEYACGGFQNDAADFVEGLGR